jgi:hypothetical protein
MTIRKPTAKIKELDSLDELQKGTTINAWSEDYLIYNSYRLSGAGLLVESKNRRSIELTCRKSYVYAIGESDILTFKIPLKETYIHNGQLVIKKDAKGIGIQLICWSAPSSPDYKIFSKAWNKKNSLLEGVGL